MNGMLLAMAVGGFGTMLAGVRESEIMMAFGFVILGASFVFMVGLNRVIWQMKAAPDVLGRVFALRVALGVAGQSIGVLIAGPLAERIFEPLLADGGALAGTVGAVIGIGAGRGMGFMYVLVGLTLILVALASAFAPTVRLLEDRVPDYAVPEAVVVAPETV
jgi:hypothetical protein